MEENATMLEFLQNRRNITIYSKDADDNGNQAKKKKKSIILFFF